MSKSWLELYINSLGVIEPSCRFRGEVFSDATAHLLSTVVQELMF